MSSTVETPPVETPLEAARRAVQDAQAALDKGRDLESKVAGHTRALRGALTGDRDKLQSLELIAFKATLENSKGAGDRQREFKDCQDRVAFLRRAVEWARLWPESEARIAMLRAEVGLAECQESIAEAESSEHEARLLEALSAVAQINGSVEVADGGRSEALRRAIHAARRATHEARARLREFEQQVRDSREQFERDSKATQ